MEKSEEETGDRVAQCKDRMNGAVPRESVPWIGDSTDIFTRETHGHNLEGFHATGHCLLDTCLYIRQENRCRTLKLDRNMMRKARCAAQKCVYATKDIRVSNRQERSGARITYFSEWEI